jgi:protocatechuate 3,4-dioxygenase beta subunit
METTTLSRFSRRRLLKLGLALPIPVLVAACGGSSSDPAPSATAARSVDAASNPTSAVQGSGSQPAAAASPTAAAVTCSGAVTPSQTEGPYWKSGSPERANLYEEGMGGTKLTLTGYVLTRACRPVADAVLDFWQADATGNYDNSGYRLRGRQSTDAQGRYRLDTVIPGLYPGRTEHIHVKIQAPGRPALTSQLYFPGVTQNRSDGIFEQALLIEMKDGAGGAKLGSFNFVVDIA